MPPAALEKMTAQYDQGGLKFQYPENWTVDEQSGPVHSGGVYIVGQNYTVTVNGPEGAFWMATRCQGQEPQALARAALDALRQDYPKLDAEPVEEHIAGHRVWGYDVDFFCLDFVNSSRIRAVRIPQGAVLVMYQAEDRQMEKLQPIFQAMTTSLLENLPVVKSALWPPQNPSWKG